MAETYRKMARFDLKLTACLLATGNGEKGKSIELMTRNICSGGAYFLTDRPMPKGTEVEMDLILELDRLHELGSRQSHIHVSGSVIRTDHQGMAVCFDRKYTISSN
jgi:PilZ domain